MKIQLRPRFGCGEVDFMKESHVNLKNYDHNTRIRRPGLPAEDLGLGLQWYYKQFM